MNKDSIYEAIRAADYAAKKDMHEKADEILSNIDVNSHDPIGQSPLHIASQNGYPFPVNYFIQKGADVNELNNMGKSPLYLASENGHYSIVSSLLNCPTLNPTLQTNYTALHIASENGHSLIVKMLLRKGIDVNSTDRYGRTPIMLAYDNSKTDIVSLLVSKGANLDFATPEIKAIIREHERNKWETMISGNKWTDFEKLDYKDKELKDEHNELKISVLDQMLKHKFIYMYDDFDFAEELRKQFYGEGEGKKRKKTNRKQKKRRKTRKY